MATSVKGQMVRDVRRFFNSPAPQTVTIGAVSAQSAALGAHEILIQPTTDAFFLVGADPTAAAGTSHFIPSGASWVITVDPTDKIAVIQSSAGGSLYISAVG